jgi:hypothetical protein
MFERSKSKRKHSTVPKHLKQPPKDLEEYCPCPFGTKKKHPHPEEGLHDKDLVDNLDPDFKSPKDYKEIDEFKELQKLNHENSLVDLVEEQIISSPLPK